MNQSNQENQRSRPFLLATLFMLMLLGLVVFGYLVAKEPAENRLWEAVKFIAFVGSGLCVFWLIDLWRMRR
jgi:hypothetical protein